MKKFVTGIIAGLLAVCFSAVAFAGYHGFGRGGEGRGHYGRGYDRGYDRPAFTEEQKQAYFEFMGERNKIRAEFLNAEAQAGRISQAEADALITLMNERLKKMKENNFERPVFTEESRAARAQYWEKLRALEIEHVKKEIANGTISQERGERILDRLEDSDDYRGYHGGGFGRGGGYCGNW